MSQSPALLPYGRQTIEDDDVAAVAAVLRSESLTGGPEVARFEEALAARVGVRFAVACANGTAALHMAAMALDMGPNQTAVVPSVTFLATANGPHFTGADVVFADVDPQSGLMTAATLAAAAGRVGAGAKVAFPVHLNGQCIDMEALSAEASARGMAVVEDACHALGARYRTAAGEVVPVGSCRHSAMTVFSFHPVKTVAMGEGGAITTNDPELRRRLVQLRNHGMDRDPTEFVQLDEAFDADGRPNPWYYEMRAPGWNYRASEINCALGTSQLVKLDRFLGRRRELAAAYDRRLAPLAPLVRPVPRVVGCDSGWHLYAVLIDFAAAGQGRGEVMNRLREAGIGTQVHYFPVHRQPYWRTRTPGLRLPGADAYYAACLSLPLFPALTDADVARVADTLARILSDKAP